jgi:precorrin-6A/cobalt-precorrin-6A reductase
MILLLDGTSDSRELALELIDEGYSIIATATTDDGIRKLESANITAIEGKLNYESLLSKCRELSITAIIDGTHPYADAMHENAIKASCELHIPLIRFEREKIKIDHDNIIYADNYENAVNIAGKVGKNIFVTTGIRNIVYYKKLIMDHNVYFRVLPDPEGIKSLIDAGVEKTNIIAMEGNFSENLNLAIMKYYKIDTLITKDSGFNAEPKIMAALSLGINVIVIARKKHEWENICNTAIEIKKILSNYRIK